MHPRIFHFTIAATFLLGVAAHSQTMSLAPATPPAAPPAPAVTWPTVCLLYTSHHCAGAPGLDSET